MKKVFVLAVLMVLISSAWAPRLVAGATGSPEEAIGNFIDQNIGLSSQPFTLAQLRLRLHATTKSTRQVQNPNVPGQTDRIVVLDDGKGVVVEAYVPATGALLIQHITVTTADRKLPAKLQIGHSSLDDIYAAFGAGAEESKGPGGIPAKRYSNLEQTASASFWFDHERLAGVEWTFNGD